MKIMNVKTKYRPFDLLIFLDIEQVPTKSLNQEKQLEHNIGFRHRIAKLQGGFLTEAKPVLISPRSPKIERDCRLLAASGSASACSVL